MGLLHDVYDDEDAGLDQTVRLRTVLAALQPAAVDANGWTAAYSSRAAAGVTGDLADIAVAPDGRSATLTLGDVMGKGTPAGLLAANLLGALDALARENPAVAVEGAENAVRARFERASAFATLFHARVRLVDGAVEFVDAGHGFAAVGHVDGRTQRIASVDLPVGLQPRGFARLPRHVDLGPGDVLLCASDGILELPDATFHTLTDLASGLVSVADLADGLAAFMASAPEAVDDDLTLVAIRREHHGSEATAPDDNEGSARR